MDLWSAPSLHYMLKDSEEGLHVFPVCQLHLQSVEGSSFWHKLLVTHSNHCFLQHAHLLVMLLATGAVSTGLVLSFSIMSGWYTFLECMVIYTAAELLWVPVLQGVRAENNIIPLLPPL